ncbi:MAG: ATP-binding protein, partial [Myxococcota bacterium]
IEFVVSDDGRGVPEDLHGRIWEMFETLEPRDRVDGSGLGLPLVRKLVEASGGRAWVVSQPGDGASFHFTWPR